MTFAALDELQGIGDIVRFHALHRPDSCALVYEDRGFSFAELNEESNRVAHALRDADVAARDRVAYLDKNSPEYLTLLFGAAKIGAVTVAVNWRLAAPEIEYILNHARAKVLLIGEEFLEHLAKMKLDSVERVIVIGSPGRTGHPAYTDWCKGYETADPKGYDPDRDDTCYQLYTSGTTGLPKGVELSNRNFLDMLPVASEEWSLDNESVNLVAMPLFHIAGSGWAVVGLYRGAQTILMRDVDPARILELIPRWKVTNAFFVPAVLQILLQTPGIEGTDFSTLRITVYGGSPISEPVLVGAMKAMNCGFIQAYGLTETTGGVSVLRAQDHDPGGERAHLLRSAGSPWGDVQIRIVDPETKKDAADGVVGEVWVNSVQNMKGYWANSEATDEAFPEGRADGGGWFRTGDAGYLEEGYLFIHDRVKDMIVSGGENIYPAEIENALMAHPDVTDVAVIGIPHEKWGETVKALVTLVGGARLDEGALIAYCRERLAHYKCPTSVDRIEAIPRNPSGKVLKTELRKPFWHGRQRMVN